MSEQILDLKTWDRSLFFEKYRDMYYPYISITFPLDITGFHDYVRKQDLSLYFSLIYLCVKTADEIENFRYRFRVSDSEDSGASSICASVTPVLIDKNRAFATHLQPGSEHFIEVDCDDYEDLVTYARKNRAKADLPVEDFGIPLMAGRMDYINFSSLPWISFTDFRRTINKKNGTDSIPKMTFGKYYSSENRLLLPFSCQTHHGLMDGLHVGRFAQLLQERLDGFSAV